MRKSSHINIGLLAHVDSGKTTLAESLLFVSGHLRKMGRVDHRDAFLDTFELEKKRGITIFSKQAQMKLGEKNVTLLDTPGHIDFSPETERTLQVLDAAVLIVSGPDGVRGHTLTLWRLLARHEVPVFLFVNKMDQPGCDRAELLRELKEALSANCVDFTEQGAEFYEEIAVCGEKALEEYLKKGTVSDAEIRALIAARKVFPCYFGSALKLSGIQEFLDGLDRYLTVPEYPDTFGARVYKIARDGRGERLTYLKVTGGSLRVKTLLQGKDWQERVNQIRIYDGAGFRTAEEAEAGCICAAAGLSKTRCGEGIGADPGGEEPQLVPVMTYRLELPEGCDVHQTYLKLAQLEEEEPQLHLVWKEALGEIHVQVMGEVQLEILQSLIRERFGLEVRFGAGSIIYKETIGNTVEGVGHFEPLRHYAEVHLLLEPGERGSGLVFAADCSEDELAGNWQRLILTHLAERRHAGVLTGSELTDVKITLKSGRAHAKHTEGGDFREATYRAVRQGLMQAESILLEPYDSFRLEVPSEMTGRAMSDIQRMSGHFEPAQTDGKKAVLTGTAPVSLMQNYAAEVTAYTHGEGHLSCEFCGYDVCHNPEEVIAAAGYDPESDAENLSCSVFCSHGAGSIVPWNEVPEHMHLPSILGKPAGGQPMERIPEEKSRKGTAFGQEEKELKAIFERTYGEGSFGKRRSAPERERITAPEERAARKKRAGRKQFLLVDGYNILFDWEELTELLHENAEAARTKLMDILCNYQGCTGYEVILVFDAYRVENNPGESFDYHNIHVVYTKEAETADQYIERTVHEIGAKYDVTVATSDALEQVIILGEGAKRMSAPELRMEIEAMQQELRRAHLSKTGKSGQYLFEALPEDLADEMEEVRLGKKPFGENKN